LKRSEQQPKSAEYDGDNGVVVKVWDGVVDEAVGSGVGGGAKHGDNSATEFLRWKAEKKVQCEVFLLIAKVWMTGR
jgi:hypothetical protein